MKNVMIVMVMVLGTILVGCKSTKEETCDNTEVIEKMEMRKVENLKPSKSNRVLIDSIK